MAFCGTKLHVTREENLPSPCSSLARSCPGNIRPIYKHVSPYRVGLISHGRLVELNVSPKETEIEESESSDGSAGGGISSRERVSSIDVQRLGSYA